MENRVEILRQYIDDILLHMDDTFNRRCAICIYMELPRHVH